MDQREAVSQGYLLYFLRNLPIPHLLDSQLYAIAVLENACAILSRRERKYFVNICTRPQKEDAIHEFKHEYLLVFVSNIAQCVCKIEELVLYCHLQEHKFQIHR